MDWLPSELLVAIAGNLTEFTDHLRVRSVCSHWRSAFKSLPLPPPLPWLILPTYPSGHLYSFSEDRVYPIPLVHAGISTIFGSASGWLLAVEGQNRKIRFSVIHPFTGTSIILPDIKPRSTLTYVGADTLVWDRSDSTILVACNTRNDVFYCHIGDNSWSPIESMRNSVTNGIVFYKTKFYILKEDTHEVVVLDGETLQEILVINPPDNLQTHDEANLLVSGEELFLLVKTNWIELFPGSASQINKVYKMNLKGELEWTEVYDIGDRAVFLDHLHCFAVVVDEKNKLIRNCIYSPLRISASTFGLFRFDLGNSEGKRTGELRQFNVASQHREVAPPTWIVPSLS